MKEEIKKYDRAYMGVLLDICHKDKIYPELKTPEDIIALPPLRRIGVLKVMEDYYAPGSKSLALRNRARAQHFMLSYRGMNQIRAAGITTSFAQRLHRDAGGNAEDAPPAAEAIFTLVYPHNPVVTNASKAEYAYGLAPGEGAGYHLGRREDMQRALLHEMGHALSNDRICKLGKFKRLSFASASHSEMVSDVFASLVLQDNSLRTELRAINAMLHNGPYFHYTNPALLLITPTDMTSAIGKNMMEIFDMAWDIAERGHAGYKTGEIVDLQREFDTQFSRQITQYEERKIKPSQVTTAMKSTAECDVLLKSIDACKQLPWLTDFQQRLLDEAADDVRFIHEMRMAKPKENYITDVVNSARFGGNVPALVEVLSREHTYMQDVMSHSYYQLMEQLEASRRPISEGLIKKIRRVGNEMDDIRHMAEAVHMGILKQQAIAGRVSDAESAISKK